MKVRRNEIYDYQKTSDNPREAKNFSPSNPNMVSLANSLKKDGQLVPVILYKAPWLKTYGILDGMRRCVASFDMLGWKEIEANVLEVQTEKELRYKQLITNLERQALTPVDKGRTAFEILKLEMSADGLDIDEHWTKSATKVKYLELVASRLGKNRGVISRYVNLFLLIPKEDREFIVSAREELKDGNISSNMAYQTLVIGRKLRNNKAVYRIMIPELGNKKNPSTLTTKTIDVVKQAVHERIINNVSELKEFLGSGKVDELQELKIFVLNTEVSMAGKLASSLKTTYDKAWRGALYVADKHPEELKEVVSSL